MQEEIIVGKDKHTIDVKPITLICHPPDLPEIKYPQRVEIDAQATLYHADRVHSLHPRFAEVWTYFMSKCNNPIPVGDADSLRVQGIGVRHLMGLIDLTLKLTDMKVPIVWKYPETYLHPAWQLGLADLAILFSRENEEKK